MNRHGDLRDVQSVAAALCDDTSSELGHNLVCSGVPADASRMEGLAPGHDGDTLDLQSSWSKVQLPADRPQR